MAVLIAACTSEAAPPPPTVAEVDPAPTTQPAGPSTAPPTTVAPLPSVTPPPGYALVWRDEFQDESLDPAKWKIEHSTFGDGGNSIHCYTPNNVSLNDGILSLTGRAETLTCPNGSTRQYTSGMITSEDRGTWTQGWFEVRARVPVGQGLWPAIWMSPNDDVYGRWPASGEIDLMENRGNDTGEVRVNAHFLGSDGEREQFPHDLRAQPGNDFAEEFHTYGLRWEESRMIFMVDGLEQHVIENWSSPVGSGDAPFDQPFFFRLNLAIGGVFPGPPDGSTPWPANFDIDWVRVFQPVDGEGVANGA